MPLSNRLWNLQVMKCMRIILKHATSPTAESLARNIYRMVVCWCSGEIKQQQLCVPRMHSVPEQSHSHPLCALTPTRTAMPAQAGGKMDCVRTCSAKGTKYCPPNFNNSLACFLNIVFLPQIKHSILFSVLLIQVYWCFPKCFVSPPHKQICSFIVL